MAGRGRWVLLVALVGACEASEPAPAGLGSSSGSSGGVSSSESSSGGAPLGHDAVNGQCVAPGQRFLDVYSCETVEGPTPHQPPGSTAMVEHDPQTLADSDYAWVLEQVLACSCTCCHAEGGIGSYAWSSGFEPAWTDSMGDAGLYDLGFLGGADVLAADDNFGFSRRRSGLPTTDADRLQGFVDRELARRGG